MRKSAGQTLIEVLVALGAIVIVTSSITIAVLSALSNAEYSKSANLASQYAQQGMELVKAMRNSDYATFANLTGSYCLAKACTTLAQNSDPSNPCWHKQGTYCVQNVDTFVREVAVEQSSPTCQAAAAKVTVSVSWADGKCTDRNNLYCHNVTVVSCLSNYQVVTAP